MHTMRWRLWRPSWCCRALTRTSGAITGQGSPVGHCPIMPLSGLLLVTTEPRFSGCILRTIHQAAVAETSSLLPVSLEEPAPSIWRWATLLAILAGIDFLRIYRLGTPSTPIISPSTLHFLIRNRCRYDVVRTLSVEPEVDVSLVGDTRPQTRAGLFVCFQSMCGVTHCADHCLRTDRWP